MAIVFLFNDHMVIIDAKKNILVDMGEIDMAVYCVFLAAIIDFFDGFVARLLKVESELGKQLDSLADMVTFGFVPGMIMYEMIARSYYSNYNAFDYPILFYAIGFLLTLCAAWRLAQFNIDKNQTTEFRGLPSPSMALIIVSLPMVALRNEAGLDKLLTNNWFLMLVTVLFSYLMVSGLPMMSLKIKSLKLEGNQWLFGLILLSVISIFLGIAVFHLLFLVIPIVILLYILLSIIKNFAENGI
jgi:CDP-diacylglycerol--serine O-phosphatidyltransferase